MGCCSKQLPSLFRASSTSRSRSSEIYSTTTWLNQKGDLALGLAFQISRPLSALSLRSEVAPRGLRRIANGVQGSYSNNFKPSVIHFTWLGDGIADGKLVIDQITTKAEQSDILTKFMPWLTYTDFLAGFPPLRLAVFIGEITVVSDNFTFFSFRHCLS